MDGEEEEAQEIEQREGGVDSDIRRWGGDTLNSETRVGGGEFGGEEKESFVRCSSVADEEVWEDGSGGVMGGGRRFVGGIPRIFHVCECGSGVSGSQGEMSLCIVDFAFLGEECADDMVQLWISRGEVSVFARPFYDAPHEFLFAGLVRREGFEEGDDSCFVGNRAREISFLVDFHEVDAQIRSGSALASPEEHEGARGKQIDGGGIVRRFDISVGDGAELLMRFVEFTFFDSRACQ